MAQKVKVQTPGIHVPHAEEDRNLAKPVISGVTALADRIILDWEKGKGDGVLIFSSYDGATFTQLDKNSHPPYEDRRKNKSLVTPELRFYKMRYCVNDKLVGLESDTVKVLAAIF